ncbi:hypothetical protein BDV26DRAFT_283684 [Aspergillus bertholletiae]|uniref:SUN domain protein n=1 Tax=Aspergillus bertholletiae TaxID=1226010 RepID=A0A5N7AZB8_9EURO|nr:hypothetical protein BDV26DRAFT_283684 [Aspergillus bertholletiae]
MKPTIALSMLLGFIATVEAARHGRGHIHNHQRDVNSVAEIEAPLEKRGGSCEFPKDAGLVAVTPNFMNAGWAMSPDEPCKPGNYCPYACPPGQVSMQWDPKATSYSYPMSMNGGLYCDEDGKIQKPFPSKPYCQDGTGAVSVRNKCKSQVSFCQTVLPGNEAMLIPTLVEDMATLAVPDLSYWCETAAHFYINPPGYDAETACVWGTSDTPIGNWTPFVAGANTDGDGNTFVKIGWNPIYLESTTPFRDVVPDFGVEIECEGDGCNGLPCKIDPAVNGVNEITGSSSKGAGDGAFCVVTVPKGEKANIVVFERSGSSGGGSSSSTTVSTSSSTVSSSSTVKTTSSTSTTSSSSTTTTTTTSAIPSTTSTTVSETSSFSSTPTLTPTGTSTIISTAKATPSGTISSGWVSSSALTVSSWPSQSPQVLAETDAQSYPMSADGAAAPSPSPTPADKENAAPTAGASMLSLVVGLIAAMAL